MDAVYEPLVRFDVTRKQYLGVLATGWRRLDEGRVFQLTLRKEVVWHNGAPFTAQDVKHSLKRLRSDPRYSVHPLSRRLRKHVQRTSYPTDHLVEIHFEKPYGPILELLAAIPIVPAPKTLAGISDPGATDSTRLVDPSDHSEDPQVIGTGPFRFLQWWPGEKIIISRFRRYWGRPSEASRVEFHVVPSLPAARKRFEQGKLDLLLDLTASQYRALLQQLGKKAHPVSLLPAAYGVLVLNTRRAPFNELRVRQAVARLLDRKKLISALPGQRPALLPGPVWQLGPQRDTALGTGPRFAPAEAARLLQAAGWRRTGPGKRWEKGGKPLRFSILTAHRSRAFNRGLRAVRDELRRSGIDLEIKKVIWGRTVLALKNRTFDAIALVTPQYGPGNDLTDLLSSSASEHGGNHAGFKSAALDKILVRLHRETNDTQRRAQERRLFQRVGEQVPFIPLFNARILGVARRPLRGVVPTFTWWNLAKLKLAP